MSAATSVSCADARRADADLELTIRARRIMLNGTLSEIERRRVLAQEVGDLLASILAEIDTLCEMAEVIVRALGMAEDRR